MFADRSDAGQRLAVLLERFRGRDAVVVGLPRGGVPVAAEVARELGLPLDVILVRKLGLPGQAELAMGAIGEGGVTVLNQEVLEPAGVTHAQLEAVERSERRELARRAREYRAGRAPVPFDGRTVIVVDDGIATGSTARAACDVARARGTDRVVLATPVAPEDWTARLAGVADEYVAVATPDPFIGVGRFYDDFAPTSDEEVTRCLHDSDRTRSPAPSDVESPAVGEQDVVIQTDGAHLAGTVAIPDRARGVVVFVHGSGSSRHSPRNRHVARILNRAGFATVLFDLLTAHEELDRANVFDVGLLSGRLVDVVRWAQAHPRLAGLPVGYFGASTGAAAALAAAAVDPSNVSAVVCRGGRPDMAEDLLAHVEAPTLLIVGGHDWTVLRHNRSAQDRLRCRNQLAVVPGAGHLFEEPGALDVVADSARDWFVDHLVRAASMAN